MGVLGILFAIAVAYALSAARAAIRWRTLAWGVGLQLLLGVLVLRTPVGRLFEALGIGFNRFISLAEEGTRFVFGELGRSENGVIFAFQILPLIIVVSCISAMLYHLGILQKVVAVLAWVMQRGMRASGAESLNVAVNLFLGQAEAPLTIRPYLAAMTRSELMTVMTSGMATVSGAILIAYVQLGGAEAENLITAVVMTAPACIMLAKIFEPETGQPETMGWIPEQETAKDGNILDAAARGTVEGLQMALQVGAMVLVFVALISIVNGILAGIQGIVGWSWLPASVQAILGPIFAPVAWLLGVPWSDAPTVGNLLGTRMALNELVSFAELAQLKDSLQPQSFLIANYALCGFANVGSVGIMIGALGAMLPDRRRELAALGMRAMLAATLSNFMTASVAGLIALTPILEA
ncbi:MAG: NupC/NupG family nucleoside CNT transporter [Bryobacterales bacterium]|nr:NupC/NupG family nucleoside CNT transporter [Bryobacterales bacterium]MDE0263169.1 NupC/NupG family nucleoside CNT transporter [Bryobacterales bacterium]MDE0620997.1 NupC/NupG family nucleoside CNT transporter [Bryobacterales bacterium]